jgi:heme/copper-type cytochrome/quinol oxidase subunit 2
MSMEKMSIWFSLGIAIVIVALVVVFASLHSTTQTRTVRDVNALLVIAPYKYQGAWVFDDPAVGLSREPFIAGIDTMIDKAVADIPNAEKGFRAIFSASPFPGANWKLEWRREESGGNWYYSDRFKMEGWLCPALLKYFPTAPREIYVKVEPKIRES